MICTVASQTACVAVRCVIACLHFQQNNNSGAENPSCCEGLRATPAGDAVRVCEPFCSDHP